MDNEVRDLESSVPIPFVSEFFKGRKKSNLGKNQRRRVILGLYISGPLFHQLATIANRGEM